MIITKTNFCTFILDSHGHCKTERICCFQNFYKKWRTLISSRPLSYQSSTLELTIEWEKINYLMIYEGWLLVCPPPDNSWQIVYIQFIHMFSRIRITQHDMKRSRFRFRSKWKVVEQFYIIKYFFALKLWKNSTIYSVYTQHKLCSPYFADFPPKKISPQFCSQGRPV